MGVLNRALFYLLFGSIFLVLKFPVFASKIDYSAKTENPLSKWERFIQSDLDSCKILLFELSKNIRNNPKELAIFHLISGSYCARIGAYEESVYFLNLSKSHFFQLQDFELLTKILNEIGIAFHLSGNRHEAKYYYERSIETGTKTGDELLEILAEINLARVYIEEEKYERGLQHLQHYISISKKFEKFEALSNAYASLVDLYLSKEDISLALTYAKELQYLAGRSNNNNVMIRALTNQAIIAFYNEENEKAEDLFQQILFRQKQQKNPLKQSEAYFNLAGFYLDFNVAASRSYLDSAYQIARSIKAYSMQEDILLFRQNELKDPLASKELIALHKIIEEEKKTLIEQLKIKNNEGNLGYKPTYHILIFLLIAGNIILVIVGIYRKLVNRQRKLRP